MVRDDSLSSSVHIVRDECVSKLLSAMQYGDMDSLLDSCPS